MTCPPMSLNLEKSVRYEARKVGPNIVPNETQPKLKWRWVFFMMRAKFLLTNTTILSKPHGALLLYQSYVLIKRVSLLPGHRVKRKEEASIFEWIIGSYNAGKSNHR
jgi:hypothetical protein